jgi:hypothetical protein
MKKIFGLLSIMMISMFIMTSCDYTTPKSSSGVEKATIQVATDVNGNSVEQKNIMERLTRDNKPGSIKHLYVISAYSGQVLIYSTVNGKVTSASKRLTPSTISGTVNTTGNGFYIKIGDVNAFTQEVLGDDGSYGSSDPYIYWFDVKGVYHQHYLSGGQIIHISDQPLAVKNVVLNMELIDEK